jgi:hypothetical protein
VHEIKTELTLAAPAYRIWDLLTDCALYPQWNPLFQSATGRLKTGEHLELLAKLPGIDPFTIKPQLLAVEAQKGICWRHTLMFAGVFTWKYCFELEPLAPERIRLIQRSAFGGILGPLFNLALGALIRDGLAELNQAVKRWAEKGNIHCLKC